MHSCAVVCWIGPGGRCLGICLQTSMRFVEQKAFCLLNKGVQWQAKFDCLYVLAVCDDDWGNWLIILPRPSNLKRNLITTNSFLCASKAIITNFYTVVKSGAGACVQREIKCDIKQKIYSDVNWNETSSSYYTQGGFERALHCNPKQKCRLALLCGFENWTFFVIQLFIRT